MHPSVIIALRAVRDATGRTVTVTGRRITGARSFVTGAAPLASPAVTIKAVRETVRQGRRMYDRAAAVSVEARYLVLTEDIAPITLHPTAASEPGEGWTISDDGRVMNVVDVERHADGLAVWLVCSAGGGSA
jgi:hypothetical protein